MPRQTHSPIYGEGRPAGGPRRGQTTSPPASLPARRNVDLERATITAAGSLVYKCSRCQRVHGHGAADAALGDTVYRVTHCPHGAGEIALALVVVADLREPDAA